METYTSTLGPLTHSLNCPHNALVFHLKLVSRFPGLLYLLCISECKKYYFKTVYFEFTF